MNVKTRQRLIGFLLLLLLAAILAPLVLRSPEQVRVALDRSIPPPPRTSTPDVAPIISEQQQQDVDDDIHEQQQAVAKAGKQALKASPKPAGPPADSAPPQASVASDAGQSVPRPATPSDSKPALPKAGFTVQVASFSDESNAQALVRRLKDADYNAYYHSVQQDGNTWQRVFVGPEIKRDNAEALKQRLAADKHFALDPGLVRAFVP